MLGVARNKSSAPTIVDIVDLVEEVLVLTGEDLSRYRVHVQKKFVGRPQVKGILSQLEQVLINLILNARQAIGEGGHLCIEVGIGGESMVEIRISDDGCGIPTEKLRHIFEPFFTTKDPDEDGHGGTGLGLSICRQIIERHQGRIRVESLVNQGTTFIIKLPVYIP